jgi:hypothetical protein
LELIHGAREAVAIVDLRGWMNRGRFHDPVVFERANYIGILRGRTDRGNLAR